ncbi:DUF3293 domain-containing protein [Salinivibrio sp. IB643]|jgi:Protein of unknown function (DUF3293).|uniref:DUF3293 domain-containing protein n=1 Tax=Salinivibrio sp. IB643 TaxID=1909445 RepID=UPI000989478B|nr:DUF3293 domain-containing protein [Salinivibrio sp. IB643]OOE98355.1 hypothetical protein BZG77_06930 [Salinivibrio sp. IB643]
MCDQNTQQDLWKTYQSIAFHAPQAPDAAAFAILTAFNPRSQPLSDNENYLRNERLAKAMTQAGLRYWPMNGGAPDGSWFEPGFAVAIASSDAVALAKTWEQNAIYWVENDTLWLLPALMTDFTPQSLNVRFSSLLVAAKA